jgi:hypothetical protein
MINSTIYFNYTKHIFKSKIEIKANFIKDANEAWVTSDTKYQIEYIKYNETICKDFADLIDCMGIDADEAYNLINLLTAKLVENADEMPF